MRLVLIILPFLFLFSTSLDAQKEKKAKAYKYEKDVEDTRKDDFPDLVSYPKVGKLENNFSIEAVDKSFVLEGGKQFIPEFYTNGYAKPTQKGMSKNFKRSKGKKVRLNYSFDVPNPEYNPLDSIASLKPKTVKEEGFMYGVLEFNKVWDECSDQPNTRAYLINITPQQIEAAKGGSVSVVYEYYDCKVPFPDEKTKKNRFTSFVLWLSDIEF
jgi:hypothetical protein